MCVCCFLCLFPGKRFSHAFPYDGHCVATRVGPLFTRIQSDFCHHLFSFFAASASINAVCSLSPSEYKLRAHTKTRAPARKSGTIFSYIMKITIKASNRAWKSIFRYTHICTCTKIDAFYSFSYR